MTYDFSQIVGYYEIHVHTTYRRTLAEIESIANASGEEAVKRRLQEVMADYESELLLRISTYRGFHMDDLVQQVYQEHPEFALELPEVEITSYPESGPSRILELHFSYRHGQETLLGYKEDMEHTIRKLSALYGSKNSQLISAQRLLERLLRDAERTEEETGMASSVYGALCQGRANDFGFTQAYLQLLKSQNIACKLVKGTYLDTAHIWCQLTIDGESYFVDPARAVVVQSTEESLFPEELAEEFGYTVS